MKTIIASQGQSIFDLAFICYGSYDVLKLMQENPFIKDLTYTDFAGKTIKYTPTNNNATFANGLSSRVVNTGNLNVNDWILYNGFWHDNKFWRDNKTWID
jgi:hypothetical protein